MQTNRPKELNFVGVQPIKTYLKATRITWARQANDLNHGIELFVRPCEEAHHKVSHFPCITTISHPGPNLHNLFLVPGPNLLPNLNLGRWFAAWTWAFSWSNPRGSRSRSKNLSGSESSLDPGARSFGYKSL